MKARSFRWILPLSTSLACLSFVSCKSTKTGYEDVVDYTTPKTGLSESEYPFDEKGNYLADVVSGKKKGKTKTETKVETYVEQYETPAVASASTITSTTSTNYELPPEPTAAFASSSSGGGTASGYTPSKPRTASVSKPKTSSSSSSKPKSKVASSKPKPKPKPKPTSLAYTIKKGDTLYGLANRYGTSVAAIKRTNGLSSDLLRDGKTIRIPKK